ncbi:MAG: hypothetical protein SOW18_05230 [Peptoniphilus sp.]|nr:hypothetical protein [Peptoniphilus sp.]MDY3118920.1 hypothetical protein [Peptoniphilus sp.]
MRRTRTRGLFFLGALFSAALIGLLLISDTTPRTLKNLNAAFGTHLSKNAVCIEAVTKPPSFFGDGVCYSIYALNDTDMVQLKKDVERKKAYSVDSSIGEQIHSDLLSARRQHPSTKKTAKAFEPNAVYYVDRSPTPDRAIVANYDALVVDEKHSLILYLVSDS